MRRENIATEKVNCSIKNHESYNYWKGKDYNWKLNFKLKTMAFATLRNLAIEHVQVGHFSNWRAASQVAAQPHSWPSRVYLVHQLPTTQPNDLPTDRSTTCNTKNKYANRKQTESNECNNELNLQQKRLGVNYEQKLATTKHVQLTHHEIGLRIHCKHNNSVEQDSSQWKRPIPVKNNSHCRWKCTSSLIQKMTNEC